MSAALKALEGFLELRLAIARGPAVRHRFPRRARMYGWALDLVRDLRGGDL